MSKQSLTYLENEVIDDVTGQGRSGARLDGATMAWPEHL
jgi:hypothetical protein